MSKKTKHVKYTELKNTLVVNLMILIGITIFNLVPSLSPLVFEGNLYKFWTQFIHGEIFLCGIAQIVYTIIFLIPSIIDLLRNKSKSH